ncbi:MAG: ATP-binding cassette domain-containing protein, partial [bacterium]|nr:ATP-binding cassette domain-containing protein [bacterium]
MTKSYGRSRGIRDLDLDVRRGEVLGLVGANGAGKTTFMRILLDLVRPTSGSVRVFGMSAAVESVALRRRCAYLPGEFVLPAGLTGHQAVRRFTLSRGDVSDSTVMKLAERLDVDLGRKVGDLSKGNKQKVGL